MAAEVSFPCSQKSWKLYRAPCWQTIFLQRSFIEDYSYFCMWTSLVVPFLKGFSLKCFMYFSSVYSLYALSQVSTGIYQAKSVHKLYT